MVVIVAVRILRDKKQLFGSVQQPLVKLKRKRAFAERKAEMNVGD